MRPIPEKLKRELEGEFRMKRCALSNEYGIPPCEGKIEWDHVWIYGGRQVNEKWAILGVCKKHHALKDGNALIKDLLQKISLSLSTDYELKKYPKKNWEQLKRYLHEKHL